MSKIAFIFAGQGAQKPGMGKDLYEKSPASKELFDRAEKIIPGILSLCFDGPAENLNQTENTQPCMLAMSMACHAALTNSGVTCTATAGFSIGEYSALICAGSLSFEETLLLVQKRALYMTMAYPQGGGMAAAIGLSAETVEDLCRQVAPHGYVQAVNYNCPGQTVIAGETTALDAFAALAAEIKGRVIRLSVSGPFHSWLMAPVAEKLAMDIAALPIRNPVIPLYSNVTALPVEDGQLPSLIARQVMSPVKWEQTVRNMAQNGIDTFIELGPGNVLSGFFKRMDLPVKVGNVQDIASCQQTLDMLNM